MSRIRSKRFHLNPATSTEPGAGETLAEPLPSAESPTGHRQPSSLCPLRRNSSRQLSPEKAAAILAGGMQEFLAHGYSAATMDRVAVAAGVSKATVYSHFRDKESLFIALIQELVLQRFNAIFDPVSANHLAEPPEVVLRSLANGLLASAASDPRWLNFMRVILGESGRFPQLAKAFVANIEQTGFTTVCHYFRHCPHLKVSDPEATARIFIGALVHFIIVQEILHGKEIIPMEQQRLIDTLIAMVLHSCAITG
jgi:TetR/AcrR family transcriptional regulator, regulator of autoinduction and epiphytic fitness